MTYDELDKCSIDKLRFYFNRVANMLNHIHLTTIDLECEYFKMTLCQFLEQITERGLKLDLKTKCKFILPASSLDELELRLTLEGY